MAHWDSLGMTDHSDRLAKQAARRVAAGDKDALRYLYVRYAGLVQRCAERILQDSYEAEDLTQQVFERLPATLSRYEARSAPFAAWLVRVTRNAALSQLRRSRAVPVEEPPEAATEAPSERAGAVGEALASLPEEQRLVLLMRHVIGLSPGEIAERLGRTEASIHGLHHRGRRTLRGALLELDAVPATMSESSG
jgi:RNA polymerase sigma-70 factor (ECF subfamily)